MPRYAIGGFVRRALVSPSLVSDVRVDASAGDDATGRCSRRRPCGTKGRLAGDRSSNRFVRTVGRTSRSVKNVDASLQLNQCDRRIDSDVGRQPGRRPERCGVDNQQRSRTHRGQVAWTWRRPGRWWSAARSAVRAARAVGPTSGRRCAPGAAPRRGAPISWAGTSAAVSGGRKSSAQCWAATPVMEKSRGHGEPGVVQRRAGCRGRAASLMVAMAVTSGWSASSSLHAGLARRRRRRRSRRRRRQMPRSATASVKPARARWPGP